MVAEHLMRYKKYGMSVVAIIIIMFYSQCKYALSSASKNTIIITILLFVLRTYRLNYTLENSNRMQILTKRLEKSIYRLKI